MASIHYLGNIQGPKGDKGEPGRRGLPGQNGVPADAATAEYLRGDSQTSAAALELIDATVSLASKPATITAHIAPDLSYHYEVIVIPSRGTDVLSAVEKRYGGDVERSWVPGEKLVPESEHPQDAYDRSMAFIVTSGDSYQAGEMTGVQIKKGVLYHGWGNSAAPDPALGREALAFMMDGTSRVYREADGHTPEQMVTEGVHTSFGFGPIVVEHGTVRDIETDPRWAYFCIEDSARAAIGRKANGDVVIVLVHGKSASWGIRGNRLGQICVEHDCEVAVMLDGGGTVQGLADTRTFHPSTDASGWRSLRSSIAIRRPVRGVVRLKSTQVPYAAGASSPGSSLPSPTAQKDDGIVTIRAAVRRLDWAGSTAWRDLVQLPRPFWPAGPSNVRDTAFCATQDTFGKVSVGTDGLIQGQVSTSGADTWVQYELVYKAAY